MEIQAFDNNNFLQNGVVYPKIYRAEIDKTGFINIFSKFKKQPNLSNSIPTISIIVKDAAGTIVADGSLDDDNTVVAAINNIII